MKHTLFFIVILAMACQLNEGSDSQQSSTSREDERTSSGIQIHDDTTLHFSFRGQPYPVYIRYPKDSIRGSILLLHGYDLPPLQWCKETDFCTKALQRGYALVIPDLKKTNYSLSVYPQTIQQYRHYPTLPWIRDSLLRGTEKLSGLLSKEAINFVAGISTGARGAGLLAYYEPDRFTACASLSVDFDITKMSDSFLYQGWFGDFQTYPERWKNECIAYKCKYYQVPTYIAHGCKDKVSPVSQSLMMYDSLSKYVYCRSRFPENAGHDYDFWGSESSAILDFFDQQVN